MNLTNDYEEFFRRAILYLERGRLEDYLFWRLAYELGKTEAIKIVYGRK